MKRRRRRRSHREEKGRGAVLAGTLLARGLRIKTVRAGCSTAAGEGLGFGCK